MFFFPEIWSTFKGGEPRPIPIRLRIQSVNLSNKLLHLNVWNLYVYITTIMGRRGHYFKNQSQYNSWVKVKI